MSTKPSELEGFGKQTCVLVVVDIFTRMGYLDAMQDKKTSILEAYKRITPRDGAHPQIVSLDTEGGH